MPLSRHSVQTYLEMSSHPTCQGPVGQSSQLSEPLWTEPGLKSGIIECKLISNQKIKFVKVQAMNEWSNILPKSSKMRIKLHTFSSIAPLKSFF